jgi:hypothetical protein
VGTAAITFVQRFGSAANLHVDAHVLAMDGVFTAADSGALTFHALPSPSDRELHELLETVRRRVLRHLHRHGWLSGEVDDVDAIADRDPVLAWLLRWISCAGADARPASRRSCRTRWRGP